MAHHQSAIKRIRQTAKRRIYNRQNKKLMRLAIRSVRESQNYDEASENLKNAVSVLDKVSARGIIHKNAAANRKSKLAKYVNSLKENKS